MRLITKPIALIGFTVMAACVVALYCLTHYFLPYSYKHFQSLYAVELKVAMRAWKSGGMDPDRLASMVRSNASLQMFICETNCVVGGKSYFTALGLKSDRLRNNGFLAITTNEEVIWIDANGNPSLFSYKKSK
jgi:hypothetical protein